jgi:hypothetical protein
MKGAPDGDTWGAHRMGIHGGAQLCAPLNQFGRCAVADISRAPCRYVCGSLIYSGALSDAPTTCVARHGMAHRCGDPWWAHSSAPLSINRAGAPSPIYRGHPVPSSDDHDAPPPITATPKPVIARPSAPPRSGKARPCHRITSADGSAISPCGSATIVGQYPTETARRHKPIHVPRVHRRHGVTWGWGEFRVPCRYVCGSLIYPGRSFGRPYDMGGPSWHGAHCIKMNAHHRFAQKRIFT